MNIATFQQGGNFKVDSQSGMMYFAGRTSVPANNTVRFGKEGLSLRASNASRAEWPAYPSAVDTNRSRLNVLA